MVQMRQLCLLFHDTYADVCLSWLLLSIQSPSSHACMPLGCIHAIHTIIVSTFFIRLLPIYITLSPVVHMIAPAAVCLLVYLLARMPVRSTRVHLPCMVVKRKRVMFDLTPLNASPRERFNYLTLLVDSGASHHICNLDQHYFTRLTPCDLMFTTANGGEFSSKLHIYETRILTHS